MKLDVEEGGGGNETGCQRVYGDNVYSGGVGLSSEP